MDAEDVARGFATGIAAARIAPDQYQHGRPDEDWVGVRERERKLAAEVAWLQPLGQQVLDVLRETSPDGLTFDALWLACLRERLNFFGTALDRDHEVFHVFSEDRVRLKLNQLLRHGYVRLDGGKWYATGGGDRVLGTV